MWARVTTFVGEVGAVDEGVVMIETKIIPKAKQIEGYCGGYWMADRTTGKTLVVSFWSSEETLRASASPVTALRDAAARGSTVRRGVEFTEEFEVTNQVEVGAARATR